MRVGGDRPDAGTFGGIFRAGLWCPNLNEVTEGLCLARKCPNRTEVSYSDVPTERQSQFYVNNFRLTNRQI
jgi:hypothetical protein